MTGFFSGEILPKKSKRSTPLFDLNGLSEKLKFFSGNKGILGAETILTLPKVLTISSFSKDEVDNKVVDL